MNINKNRIALAMLMVALVGTTTAAWYFASKARTVDQIAAEASPPDDSIVGVEIEQGQLVDVESLAGTLERTGNVKIEGPSSVSETSKAIVSGVPVKKGDAVKNGSLLLEISGRPVFTLQGEVSTYRDYVEGETRGDDVRQLQSALSRLYGTPITGTFDAETASAVRKLYGAWGYNTITADSADSRSEQDVNDSDTQDGSQARNSNSESRIVVPAGEIQFIPSFPMKVSQVHASTNDPSGESPALTLSSGDWHVAFKLPKSLAEDIKQTGNSWTYEFVSNNIKDVSPGDYTMKMREVDSQSHDASKNDKQATTPFLIFDLKMDDVPEGSMAGDKVILDIIKERSANNALIVPVSALWSNGEKTFVTVIDNNKVESRQVQVTPTISNDGRTVIKPINGSLLPTETVAVGKLDRKE